MSISPSSGQLWPSAHTSGQFATSPGFPVIAGSHTRASMNPYVKLNLPRVLTSAGGIDLIADAAVLALADQGQAKRPAALADLGGVVAVLFRGIDRGGDARAVPSGRPLGRVQAGAAELIVERQLPVTADTGRHRCQRRLRCLFPQAWPVRRRWLRSRSRPAGSAAGSHSCIRRRALDADGGPSIPAGRR